MIICKICNQSFENDNLLLKHLRSHKITQAEYFQTHFPRRDKISGDIIKFKNKDYYFNTDFNDKRNLKKWFDSVSPEESKNYIIALFKERKERKNLIYSPSQAELRTLMFPGIKYINDNLGDYFKFCADLGFKNRFSQYELMDKPINISRRKIFVDTREKTPLVFKLKTISEALKFGDYALKDGSGKHDCYIERKSLGDFYGTLSMGYDRFCREIDRSVEANAYLIVIIESDINSVYAYPHLPHLRGKIKISPEFILHNMRTIAQKYENLQFLFVENRKESSRVIEKLFASEDEYRKVDLQYSYDIKKL